MTPVLWFIAIMLVSVLGFAGGLRLGHGSRRRAVLAWTAGFGLLAAWLYLQRSPAVALHAIPAAYLRFLEGTAAAPIFMFTLGLAWARGRKRRQRGVTLAGAALGVLYLFHGGFWMLQATPAHAFGDVIPADQLVRQSQSYSCVPAACATALTQLGYPASEAQMARLTFTRPGTGASLVRAVEALRQRLEGTPRTVALVQPASYEELAALPMPALAVLHYEANQSHMVVLQSIAPDGVTVADPADGPVFVTRADFDEFFTGQVVIFRPR